MDFNSDILYYVYLDNDYFYFKHKKDLEEFMKDILGFEYKVSEEELDKMFDFLMSEVQINKIAKIEPYTGEHNRFDLILHRESGDKKFSVLRSDEFGCYAKIPESFRTFTAFWISFDNSEERRLINAVLYHQNHKRVKKNIASCLENVELKCKQ